MSNPITRTMSMKATRTRPWEPWVEPAPEYPEARYFGVWVQVIHKMSLCALVRRPDGLSCVVEVADLVEVGQ